MAKNWQEQIENVLVERLCKKNGWDYGGEDYDLAVLEVKWFLSQPEIGVEARQKEVDEAEQKGYQKALEKMSFILPAKFKEAEQRGVRGVMEWIKKHGIPALAVSKEIHFKFTDQPNVLIIDLKEWQNFLKSLENGG